MQSNCIAINGCINEILFDLKRIEKTLVVTTPEFVSLLENIKQNACAIKVNNHLLQNQVSKTPSTNMSTKTKYYLKTTMFKEMFVQYQGNKSVNGEFMVTYTDNQKYATSFDNAKLANEFAQNISNPYHRIFEVVSLSVVEAVTDSSNTEIDNSLK